MPSFIYSLFSESFKFYVGHVVYNEISKKNSYSQIKSCITTYDFTTYNLGEILKPFFGKNQIKKGEHEVIEIAYQHHNWDKFFTMILDDHEARQFVQKRIPTLRETMTGTVGFLAKCSCDYNVVSKNSALHILSCIERSPFHASETVIKPIRQRIEEC